MSDKIVKLHTVKLMMLISVLPLFGTDQSSEIKLKAQQRQQQRIKESQDLQDFCNKGIVVSSGTLSLLSGWYYYDTIVGPFIVELAQEKGLAYAIAFNAAFVMNYPAVAAVYAIPLAISLVTAKIAYDHYYKIPSSEEKK